jgi:hypothetical protein
MDSDAKDRTRTVRELGGEFWAELNGIRLSAPDTPIGGIDTQAMNDAIDVLMGVLARHCGKTILNDEDLPVAPRPTVCHVRLKGPLNP